MEYRKYTAMGQHWCAPKKGQHTVLSLRCEACGMARLENQMLVQTEALPGSGGMTPVDSLWKSVAYAETPDPKIGARVPPEAPTSALDVQVDGDHYKKKKIQPVEYIHANGLGFLEGCVIKRITRWRDKPAATRFKDLEKIKHEIDLLIELETRNGNA